MPIRHSPDDALADPRVTECVTRGFIEIAKERITYNLGHKRTYSWNDPEEWVRCRCIAFLIIEKKYPANRLRTEVSVPRRVPSDHADIVVYSDDRCRSPYLVVENKSAGQSSKDRAQWIEQVFGNANSLRAPYALYDEWIGDRGYSGSTFYNLIDFPASERKENIKGTRDAIPDQYGEVPEYTYIAGGSNDISTVKSFVLESKIRRAYSLIGQAESAILSPRSMNGASCYLRKLLTNGPPQLANHVVFKLVLMKPPLQ